MFKTLIYWILMAKFFLYMFFNLNRLKEAKKNNDFDKFEKLAYTSYKFYCDAIFKSSSSKFEVIGDEKIDLNETYLVVSNHLSIVDIASVIRAFPKNVVFVSKKELSNVVVFSEWMRVLGCIFMDRQNARASIEELNKGIEVLKNGTSMCVFPEGTRSTTGEIGEFKKGSFKLALKSGAKILPMVLVGTRSVYEDNQNKIGKGDIKVIFLDPIDINKLSSDEVKDIHNIVRNKINDSYKKFV